MLEHNPNDACAPFHLSVCHSVGEGIGTPAYWESLDDICWAYFGAQLSNGVSSEWARHAFATPDLLRELTGVFCLIMIDRVNDRAMAVTDRLGVQAVYYSEQGRRLWVSSHLMWLLMSSGHDGTLDKAGFLDLLTFGHTVDFGRNVYSGVKRLPNGNVLMLSRGSPTLKQYWTFPAQRSPLTAQAVSRVSASMRQSVLNASKISGALVGTTAGKDCLAVASTIPAGANVLAGTFGDPASADRSQGATLSRFFARGHVHSDLCPPSELEYWLDHIAFHSAGLATGAYVDMARFVAVCVPKGSSYVMGEGGEAVRDLFPVDVGDPVMKIVERNTTPSALLEMVLHRELIESLRDYPLGRLRALSAVRAHRAESLAVNFHRMHWLPHNAAARHHVLSALRPKCSPFLEGHVLDETYGLRRSAYASSELHRGVIATSRPELLELWEHPAESAITVQNWPHRFSLAGGMGYALRALLSRLVLDREEFFHADGILRLAEQNLSSPSRGMWLLLRLASLLTAVRIVKHERLSRLSALLVTDIIQRRVPAIPTALRRIRPGDGRTISFRSLDSSASVDSTLYDRYRHSR